MLSDILIQTHPVQTTHAHPCKYMNACRRTYECCHASAVWEDQCVPIDAVLPSAHAVTGGGGRHGEGWEDSQMGGAH